LVHVVDVLMGEEGVDDDGDVTGGFDLICFDLRLFGAEM
jgi:hypothetical protein